MKARILATGEIVEVTEYTYSNINECITSIKYESNGVPMPIYQGRFEIILDEPQTAELSTTEPDLEQRRYELAKAAMQGLCTSFMNDTTERDEFVYAAISVRIADAMIAELKKAKWDEA